MVDNKTYDTLQDLVPEFLDDAKQHLESLNENLLKIEANIGKTQDMELVNSIFRSAHNLKGTAGMFGFLKINRLTHRFENILNRIRNGRIDITSNVSELLFFVLDNLSRLINDISQNGLEASDIDESLSRIDALMGDGEKEKDSGIQKEDAGSIKSSIENNRYKTPLKISDEVKKALMPSDILELEVIADLGHSNLFELSVKLNRDCFLRKINPIKYYKDIERLGTLHVVTPVAPDIPALDLKAISEYDLEIRLILETGYSKDYLMSLLHLEQASIMPIKEMIGKDGRKEEKDKGEACIPLEEEIKGQSQEADICPQKIDKRKFLQVFIDETEEEIEELNASLLTLEKAPDDKDILHNIFRLAHRIKSSSAAMGYEIMSEITHYMENILANLRDMKEFSITEEIINLFFNVVDNLKESLNIVKSGGIPQENAGEIIDRLKRLESTKVKDIEVIKSDAHLVKEQEDILSDKAKKEVEARLEQGKHLYKIKISLEKDIKLSFERAYLIIHLLEDIGEIITTEPSLDMLKTAESINYLSIILSSLEDEHVIRKAVDVDMVKEIMITEFEKKKKIEETKQVVNDKTADKGEKTALGHTITQTLRVDPERLDNLMNLAGELTIVKSRLFQVSNKLASIFKDKKLLYRMDEIAFKIDRIKAELNNAENLTQEQDIKTLFLNINNIFLLISQEFLMLEADSKDLFKNKLLIFDLNEINNQLGRITTSIQTGIMQTRMVSIDMVFRRFNRIIRDLAREKGKDIILKITGEDTELDKKMVDELGDPLTHIIRNAVDHGIESPEERKAAGKPQNGMISLNAYHKGSHICVEVADDGRGIDVSAIKNRLIRDGIKTEEEIKSMTDKDIINIIFTPGFSTASVVTDISGRGVGLDVVKKKVAELKGVVEVESIKGRGTKFIIKLPLTLAIITALLCKLGEQIYAIPLESVIEIVNYKKENIYTIEGSETIKLRQKVISLLYLDEIIGIKERVEEKGVATVVIVGTNEHQIGILVDSLIGEQEIVIKSLTQEFRLVEGISGASIMGDGMVSLILDVPALIRMVSSYDVIH